MDDESLLRRFDALVKAGVVLYDERQTTISYEEDGLEFQFLLTNALAKKPTIHASPLSEKNTATKHATNRPGSDISTAEFELGNIGTYHFVAANKFCFARPHLMLLTSDGYRRQDEPLDQADLEAAWTLLEPLQGEYVVFFNCGRDSGNSRMHKHMQVMPRPATSFASFLDDRELDEPKVPFKWYHQRYGGRVITYSTLRATYMDLLLRATADTKPSQDATDARSEVPAHNLIFTKRWMIVIPRRQAGINKEAGANAMGMLGVIAVATQQEIQNWASLGLADTLRRLGYPRAMREHPQYRTQHQ